MKKANKILLVIVVSIIILGIPAVKWIKHLDVRYNGAIVKYEISGYDPVNILKGNYVRISYSSQDRMVVAHLEESELDKDSSAYVVFDKNGKIIDVSAKKPKSDYYLKCETSSWYDDDEKAYGTKTSSSVMKRVWIDWPTEYYASAERAKEIEDNLRNFTNESRYEVTIKVKNDIAIIVDLEKMS